MFNFKTKQIRCEGKMVNSFALTKDKTKIAIGYNNGSIYLHRMDDECKLWFNFFINLLGPPIVFNGHKTGVNCLAFSNDGFVLASGGKV